MATIFAGLFYLAAAVLVVLVVLGIVHLRRMHRQQA